ncbi:MAG: amidohydrolase [Bacteroidota bacterium]
MNFNKIKIVFSLIVFFMYSCNFPKMKVDSLYYNATVYTVDSVFSVVESFVADKGMIIDCGKKDELEKKYEFGTKQNLSGQFVYPGFNDAHCHFYSYAKNNEFEVNLKNCLSFDEVITRLINFQKEHNYFWISGRGWDQNDWSDKQFPEKEKLDELFPENPIVLLRIDGHAVLANNKALEISGIDEKTKFSGGEVVLKNGIMTGLLLEKAADFMKDKVAPPDSKQKAEALLKAQNDCFAAGLTSITDAGLIREIVLLYDSIQKSGSLKLRINAMLDPNNENFEKFVKNGVYKTERLRVGTIKMYTDGALGSRGACLLKPYSDDSENSGMIVEKMEFYNNICKLALDNNYQLSTHAIGDSANRLILDVYAKYLKGKNDLRWRVEHAQIVDKSDIQKFAEYSIIPSVQATHATSDMYWAEERLGKERIKNAYCYKELLDQNTWLPNGTDFPIEEIYPIYTFYAAIARKDEKGYPENGFMPENALSRKEALQSITIWPAKASFEEHVKGSIEKGKVADFVVLNKDIMTIPENEILKTKVVMTVINGEIVYKK